MAKKKEETIVINDVEASVRTMTVTIEGDGDIVLNKMNDVVSRNLIDQRKDKAKDIQKSNMWEEVITSIHWLNEIKDEFSEETMLYNLNPENGNAPCISAFGLKKSFGDAVVRNGIDTYKTKFDASMNIAANLVPIQFTEWHLDEKLMSPKKGSPVLVRLNRFSGWRATFTIRYMENVYSAEQIANIINLAGFGLGIGSGRSSGYGRYHIIDIK